MSEVSRRVFNACSRFKEDDEECCCFTDIFCVSCRDWCCEKHLNDCVQCGQPVCGECCKTDICCLVRPWGKMTERHVKRFYQHAVALDTGLEVFEFKLVDYGGMTVINDLFLSASERHVTRWNDIRKSVVR